ncbi:ScaI family restriction endonuclease [Coleofasciculus sp.]|uniref:ScaI family restriction endonuclease n=1 Tax=Coleofasciculus sp. TaxID=3100458 RepID=UPI003A330436
MASPYEGLPEEQWLSKTRELIENHPLEIETIRCAALDSWSNLWSTTIGTGELSVKLDELDVPATVVGYFFEKLFVKCLETNYPNLWRGGRRKNEKDIVYIPDNSLSIELKTSGQLGDKIFGNRSYGKSGKNTELEKKDKSGYYITVNFHEQTITLLRFGWIDQTDWKAQKAETGQAASLSRSVYEKKLIPIEGDYRLDAPVGILEGVGSKRLEDFAKEGVKTIRDLKNYEGRNSKLLSFQEKLKEYEFLDG